MSTTVAADLRGAISALDPARTLRGERELENFHVRRTTSPLTDMKLMLRHCERQQQCLFTGHRGSGKSTELARLAVDLEDEFEVVHFSIRTTTNMYDLQHVDLLLSMGLEVFKRASAHGPKFPREVLQKLMAFTQDVTRETEISVNDSTEVASGLQVFFAHLSAKLTTEEATRVTVRETVKHRVADLIELINLIAHTIESLTGKKLLLIVEDLDKLDLDTAKQLFYHYGSTLTAPKVTVIYTIPIALRHDNDFRHIQIQFVHVHTLPNFKVSTAAGDADAAGRAGLEEVLSRRVDKRLFQADALEKIIRLSGGLPVELLALAQLAVIEALKKERSDVDLESVNNAARRRRMDYQLLLSADQLKLIATVNKTKRIDNDDRHRGLLHNLSVLEYRNGSMWYDAHPLVEDLFVGL